MTYLDRTGQDIIGDLNFGGFGGVHLTYLTVVFLGAGIVESGWMVHGCLLYIGVPCCFYISASTGVLDYPGFRRVCTTVYYREYYILPVHVARAVNTLHTRGTSGPSVLDIYMVEYVPSVKKLLYCRCCRYCI
ncbi:hypothetical protein BZA05DRAFT_392189 [Tricharina praecox]|uniref:uncharacterized protein n=1 Tax=Tricharina praecox TaxID=43433 RepID=UPI00221F912B|nr:uncharacterized protein BZA05DRAFT_392189 [Tricharina praecox]KAI5854665.1 hypothetical protein BZA05DRAFT_392189 [Tricharina praecox]